MSSPSTRTLYVLRHLKSSWDAPMAQDHERTLAPRGRLAGQALVRHLRSQQVSVDLVLCSTATRTRQTWEAVADGVAGAPQVRFLDEIYEAGPADLLRVVRDAGEARSVLLVGHMPGVAALTLGLADDQQSPLAMSVAENVPTGGLVTLGIDAAWSELAWGAARLLDVVRPRELPAP